VIDADKKRLDELHRSRRAQGLCKCGAALATGFAACERCLEKTRQDVAELRVFRLANALCVHCAAPTEQGRRYCVACRERQLQYQRSYQKRHRRDLLSDVEKFWRCRTCGALPFAREDRCPGCGGKRP
jgi:hypothetical protein